MSTTVRGGRDTMGSRLGWGGLDFYEEGHGRHIAVSRRPSSTIPSPSLAGRSSVATTGQRQLPIHIIHRLGGHYYSTVFRWKFDTNHPCSD